MALVRAKRAPPSFFVALARATGPLLRAKQAPLPMGVALRFHE